MILTLSSEWAEIRFHMQNLGHLLEREWKAANAHSAF